MGPQIKAVGYVRVSTAGQADEGESLSTQKQQIQDFVKQRGWQLTNIYADEGISGIKIEHRTQFQQMIQDAKAGQFSVIVFMKLSRFARNAREYQNLAYGLEQHGVQLASIKENIDPTTKTGKMIAGILALFAEWEHETIREQMHENRMIRWGENRAFIGRPPFGYTWNKEKRALVINESEAEIFRRIVSMYIEQRMSYRDICIRLNADGVTCIRINKDGVECKRATWSGAAIGFMLKNPACYGHYVLNQYEYEYGGRGAGTRRSKRRKPMSETITFEIPPLITKTRWDEIQQTTQFNKVKSKHAEAATDFFLRDILVCRRCGAKVKPRIGSKKQDGSVQRYYVCYWAGTSEKSLEAAGRQKCSLPFIQAKDLEAAVWGDIKVMFALNPKKASGEMFNTAKHDQRIGELEESVKHLGNDLSRKQKVRDILYKFLTFDDMDHNELRQKLRQNKDELLEIESNLKDAKNRLEDIQNLRERQKEITDFLTNNKQQLKQLRRDIAKLSLEDRKTLVEGMLQGNIVVDYQEDNTLDGSGGIDADYRLRLNPEILQRFVDEGKIHFNKNS